MKKKLQGMLLFLLIGIFALSATGCSALLGTNGTTNTATATPDPNATIPPQQVVDAEYKLYDTEADFSISYHSSWVIKTNLSEDGKVDGDYANVTFTIPEGISQDVETQGAQVYPTLSVFQFSIENKESFDLKSYVNDQLKDLEKQVYQFTLLKEVAETEVNGVPAYMFEYVGSVLNANDVKVKQVILADEENVFILTYGANADFYNNQSYLAIAEKTIASFTLK